jgi:acetyl esterase/lipase
MRIYKKPQSTLLACLALLLADALNAQVAAPATVPADDRALDQMEQKAGPGVRHLVEVLRTSLPRKIGPAPLYDGAIPNSRPAPDAETHEQVLGMELIRSVSRPTYTVYLPASSRASGAAVIIFPGGGYVTLSWSWEGTRIAEALQDRGIAAILVKYRLPSDETMIDKSIGPLQDAQQALRQVRHNAKAWGVDAAKVGVMGFSAGGHLASMAGTNFNTALVPNPDALSVRPDFMILVYAAISVTEAQESDKGAFKALLGPDPSASQIRRFSSELQVTAGAPPTLLLAAENDSLVDVDQSIHFYEALRHNGVPAELVLFPQGQHGFFQMSRDEWMAPMWAWLVKNGWLKD